MSVSPEELFEGYDVLIGGLGEQEVSDFSSTEDELFNKFIEDSVDALEKISTEIAKDFEGQAGLFHEIARIFKAKVDKPFGGLLPTSGQFGAGLLIPQDVKYVATASSTYPAYTHYSSNSWNITLTAGTARYLLGDGTNYYKASPTTGSRAIFCIMKNGIIEIGTTPSFNQFQIKTERVTYPAFSVHPLVDQPVERGYTIYRYNVPFAIPVFYDFGIMIGGMPLVSKTSDVRLIGVIFYEYDFRKNLRYIS